MGIDNIKAIFEHWEVKSHCISAVQNGCERYMLCAVLTVVLEIVAGLN